jgi:hypothetical protein
MLFIHTFIQILLAKIRADLAYDPEECQGDQEKDERVVQQKNHRWQPQRT